MVGRLCRWRSVSYWQRKLCWPIFPPSLKQSSNIRLMLLISPNPRLAPWPKSNIGEYSAFPSLVVKKISLKIVSTKFYYQQEDVPCEQHHQSTLFLFQCILQNDQIPVEKLLYFEPLKLVTRGWVGFLIWSDNCKTN